MNTKILSVFLMSVLMLSVMGTFVLADENDVSADAGLSQAEIASATADDNVEGSSGIAGDRLKIIFAANKAKKAEIRTKIALKQTVIMKYRLESHQIKVAEVHAVILVRQSEKMNAEQLTRLTEVFGNINEKVSSKISKIEELQENLIARLLVVAPELSEEEIRAKLEAFENSLDEKRKLREEQFKSKIETELKENGEFRQKFELRADDQRIKIETETDDDSDDEVIALN